MKEIDQEEFGDEQITEDPDKLGIDFMQEQDQDEEVVTNMHEFIKDKLTELNAGVNKKLYLENIISDKKLENKDNKNNSLPRGRHIDNNKKNKKLKLL